MNSAHEQQTRLPKKDNMSKSNKTGIPFQLKAKYEALSGFSFDDVRVHYHSDKPAQLQALAYTQGRHVYIGPGQETHLEHELGHVVQQKQGIVHPTKIVNKLPLNDDPKLEAQSDAMVQGTPVMQRRAVEEGASSMTVQLLTFRGHKYRTLRDLNTFLCDPKLGNFIDLFVDNIDISRFECSNENLLVQELSRHLETYLQGRAPEVLAKFYRYILQKSYYIPRKEECNEIKSFDQIVIGQWRLNKMLPDFFLATIIGLMKGIQNWNFFFALKFHDIMERDNFYDENNKENIDPTDITEDFIPGKSCVITALLYAENEVFGVKEPELLHNILFAYFSDYSSSKDDKSPNMKNNVWKNYSDDHVYPSLYKYLGYERIDVHSQSINSIFNKIPAKSKKKIAQQPNILAGTKGIIVVEGHAIGYRCDASSILKLKDNIHGDDTGAIISQYGAAHIIAIYKKK